MRHIPLLPREIAKVLKQIRGKFPALCPLNKESNLNRMQHLIFECQYCVRTKLVDFDFTAFSDNMQSCKALKSFEMPVEECKTAT